MAYMIKRLLQSAPEELYRNTSDSTDRVATNISLCNISLSTANVYLAVVKEGGAFADGAIVYGRVLAVNETVEIGDRIVPPKYTIQAYSTTGADLVALSVDVLGDTGEFTV